MANILFSVGQNGKNRADDVRTVQQLLNQNIGKLTPLLSSNVNGICDTQTIILIREFQKRVLKLPFPDARVDPGGKTLRALNDEASRGGGYDVSPSRQVGEPILEGLKLPTPAAKVLKEILKTAAIHRARVTSVSRTPYDQARIMYDNCKTKGIAYNKVMYAAAGDKVIDVYDTNKDKPADLVIELMRAKIVELGPTKISKHISDSHYTFDVAPSSIAANKHKDFENAINAHKAVSKLIPPPIDPAFHIEIPKTSPNL